MPTNSWKKRLVTLVEEELQHPEVNQQLLDEMRAFAAQGSLYTGMDVITRNTLNAFFQEVQSMIFNELVSGEYGAKTVIDAAIVLAFETGYKLRGRRAVCPPPS